MERDAKLISQAFLETKISKEQGFRDEYDMVYYKCKICEWYSKEGVIITVQNNRAKISGLLPHFICMKCAKKVRGEI